MLLIVLVSAKFVFGAIHVIEKSASVHFVVSRHSTPTRQCVANRGILQLLRRVCFGTETHVCFVAGMSSHSAVNGFVVC